VRSAFVASALFAFALANAPAARAQTASPIPTASATPTTGPDYVAVVGPLHGAWVVGDKAATIGEKIAAGASIAQARPGVPGSLAIYAFDGRLITKTCPTDPSCGGSFTLDPLGDTTGVKEIVRDATTALAHYTIVYATPAQQSPSDATPVDAVAPLANDGAVDLGDLMQGVAFGPYRLVLRPLDPHARFAPAGDPIIKLFTWNGESVSVVVGGVPEGLYGAQLFSRDAEGRALGGSAWAAVIATRGESARTGYLAAQRLAAKWNDPEARQLFLRSYLVNAVFPQPTPGPGRHGRRR
jgi:hypothetical protein